MSVTGLHNWTGHETQEALEGYIVVSTCDKCGAKKEISVDRTGSYLAGDHKMEGCPR